MTHLERHERRTSLPLALGTVPVLHAVPVVWAGVDAAVATVTTAGYGDVHPVTLVGRVIATALMVVGISLVGVMTAAVAAWFVRQEGAAAG